MAKIKSMDERVADLVGEWQKWRTALQPYWAEIDKHQEMYEFYKREGSQTSSDVSLNTAFAIIESMVSKANSTSTVVTVKSDGINGLDKFEEYISTIVEDALFDPTVAQIKGSFRKQREMFLRDFLVKGFGIAEVNYLYREVITNGKKKIVADNPYVTVLNYKNYIFNPTETFDTSEKKYIEKWVSLEALQAKEADPKAGTGLYTNLQAVRASMGQDNNEDNTKKSDYEQRFVSGDQRIPRRREAIHLLECWDGPKLTVIANQSVVIRDKYDPKKIGWSGIVTAGNYKLEGRPYPYGEIAGIYKPIRAQDTILNQSIEMVNRYLRPGLLVSDYDANLDDIIQILEQGGVAYGDAKSITSVQTNLPPSAAFQTLDTMEQAVERVARFGLGYSAGQSQQGTDKTQGTASGIKNIQMAAEPNFEVKLDTIEDSFMEPVAQVYLRMIGNLMDEYDVRYGLLKGKKTQWVGATKGILTGKATIQDLITVGIIPSNPNDPSVTEQAIGYLVDKAQLEPGKVMEKTVVFDTDWIIQVKLDNQSAADKQQRADRKINLMVTAQQLGVQFHPERTFIRLAEEEGWEDVEDLILTEQEKQEQQQQQQQAQQQQVQAEIAVKQAGQKPDAGPQGKSPSESINFKDLPPEGQAQMAQQAGLNLNAQHFTDHLINQAILDKVQPPQPFTPPPVQEPVGASAGGPNGQP